MAPLCVNIHKLGGSWTLLCNSLPHLPPPPPPLPSLAEVLSLGDELEFAAIQAIHSQLDDNDDGKVDLSESEEVYTCSSGHNNCQ